MSTFWKYTFYEDYHKNNSKGRKKVNKFLGDISVRC